MVLAIDRQIGVFKKALAKWEAGDLAGASLSQAVRTARADFEIYG